MNYGAVLDDKAMQCNSSGEKSPVQCVIFKSIARYNERCVIAQMRGILTIIGEVHIDQDQQKRKGEDCRQDDIFKPSHPTRLVEPFRFLCLFLNDQIEGLGLEHSMGLCFQWCGVLAPAVPKSN